MATKQKFRFDGKTSVLEDLCVDIVDCHHSTPTWTVRGKLVVRNFNIKNGRLHLDDCSYTDEETFYDRIARSKPEPGDLIITREAPMGEVCIIPDGVECCLGQRMVLIKPDRKKVDPKYLLYALQSEFVQKQIKKSDKTGSIVSNLRIPVLKGLLIPSFEVETEEQIGSVLDSLVSKIELNNRINAELEAMAKAIYDYWFVQFDFPISKEQAKAMGKPKLEGKPYKASGGKMVWSEELKRKVPEGWEVKTLNSLCTRIQSGGTPSSARSDYYSGSINWFTTKELRDGYVLTSENQITDSALDESSAKLFPRNSVVIAIYAAPTVGRLGILTKESAFNQACCGMIVDENFISVEYLFLTLIAYRTKLNVLANGTTQKNLSVGTIKDLHIVSPPEYVMKAFTQIVRPMFQRRESISQENERLSELRNWLLPMLMNGQVRIKEAFQPTAPKPILSESKPVNSYFYQTQLIAAIVNASKKNKITHGEMTLAKYTYLVDKLYRVPTYFNYERLHLGPYPKEMKKIVNNKKFFKIKNNEVSVVPQEKEYNYQFQKQVEDAVAELASYFNQYKGQERSHQTELLATVCKVVEDIKSTDLKAVRESMKNWPIDLKTSKFKNKAEKFGMEETRRIMQQLTEKNWHTRLIQQYE